MFSKFMPEILVKKCIIPPFTNTPTGTDPKLHSPTQFDTKISLKTFPDPGLGPVRSGPSKLGASPGVATQVFTLICGQVSIMITSIMTINKIQRHLPRKKSRVS